MRRRGQLPVRPKAGVDLKIERARVHLGEGLADLLCCIKYKDIDPAERLQRRISQLRAGSWAREVGRGADSAATECTYVCCSFGSGALPPGIVHDHISAGAGERKRDGPSYAPACAGHERAPGGQIEQSIGRPFGSGEGRHRRAPVLRSNRWR
jgi:hypothetical protein